MKHDSFIGCKTTNVKFIFIKIQLSIIQFNTTLRNKLYYFIAQHHNTAYSIFFIKKIYCTTPTHSTNNPPFLISSRNRYCTVLCRQSSSFQRIRRQQWTLCPQNVLEWSRDSNRSTCFSNYEDDGKKGKWTVEGLQIGNVGGMGAQLLFKMGVNSVLFSFLVVLTIFMLNATIKNIIFVNYNILRSYRLFDLFVYLFVIYLIKIIKVEKYKEFLKKSSNMQMKIFE